MSLGWRGLGDQGCYLHCSWVIAVKAEGSKLRQAGYATASPICYLVLRMTELWTIAWFSQWVIMGRTRKPWNPETRYFMASIGELCPVLLSCSLMPWWCPFSLDACSLHVHRLVHSGVSGNLPRTQVMEVIWASTIPRTQRKKAPK